MDWVLKVALEGHFKGLKINEQFSLTDLDYADDILLLTDSLEDAQIGIDRIQLIGGKVGLKLNAKKTVWLSNEIPDGTLIVQNEIIHKSEQLIYLGSQLNVKGGMTSEVDRRLSAGNAAFWSYRKLWCNRAISESTKVKIYSAVVRSILLYATESWSLNSADKRKLEVFHRSKLRWILGVKWRDRISNSDLFGRAGITQIDAIIRQRRWRWFGHVLRMDPARWPFRVLNAFGTNKDSSKRKRGAPVKTWKREMMKFSWEEVDWAKVNVRKPHWKKWCAGEWLCF